MQLVGQFAADRIGINATDLNCLNILSFSGQMTAGELARATGLTTASITGVLDRLEEAGYVRRERDSKDRRRVVVHLELDKALANVAPLFLPMVRDWQERVVADYTDDELRLIVDFYGRMEQVFRDQVVRLAAATRDTVRTRDHSKELSMPTDRAAGPHPLDPLSAAEIAGVGACVRREHAAGPGWRFASIDLAEPGKDELAALAAGQPASRAAVAVCWNRTDGQAYRATVALRRRRRVTSWQHLPGQQPNMTADEWHECDEMLRAHPQVIAALAARGLTDPALALTDVWAYGADLVPERYAGRRLGWADVWYRASPDGNPYAHHVTGLHPVVDLNRMELLELEDAARPKARTGCPRLTASTSRAAPDAAARGRAADGEPARRPLFFSINGRLLSWQNWQLRIGFNGREGLVLHTVGFADGGRVRPVAHRLSFAEMVVPYRDATRTTTGAPRSTSASGAWAT